MNLKYNLGLSSLFWDSTKLLETVQTYSGFSKFCGIIQISSGLHGNHQEFIKLFNLFKTLQHTPKIFELLRILENASGFHKILRHSSNIYKHPLKLFRIGQCPFGFINLFGFPNNKSDPTNFFGICKNYSGVCKIL